MHILFVVRDLHTEYLGIMSLSSILKRAGHNIDIVEARYDRIKRKLEKNNFTILAYSAHVVNISYYLNLNRKIKEEFNVFSVFGGPLPTLSPEIINKPGVDGVCIGEGEYALLGLVNNLAEGKSITNIANWWIKKEGQIFRSSSGPLIKDLDTLPFVDRTLFHITYEMFILTSRGCPYRCSYCSERNEFRRRSVDNVIEELREVKSSTHARFLRFVDSTFNISLPWLREFSEKYKKEIGLPFCCNVRADLVTPESIKCLKEAGCFFVSMGIETANDYLRNEVLKKDLTKEQIISAIEIIKRYKLRLLTYNMLCIPFSSLEDDLETLRLNIQCRPDYATASLFFIHKHTDIYNSLVKYSRFKHLETTLRGGDFHINLELQDCAHKLRNIKNLRKLFCLAVEFPFLLPLISFLKKLPLFWFYSFLDLLWEGYCYYFRLSGRYVLGRKNFTILLKRRLKKMLWLGG